MREIIAEIQHEIWAHWMKYLFSQCVRNIDQIQSQSDLDGQWIIPHDKVVRWHRQINTPYHLLSEKEKESDRHQSNKILAVLEENL